jgi:hypothetical protein
MSTWVWVGVGVAAWVVLTLPMSLLLGRRLKYVRRLSTRKLT